METGCLSPHGKLLLLFYLFRFVAFVWPTGAFLELVSWDFAFYHRVLCFINSPPKPKEKRFLQSSFVHSVNIQIEGGKSEIPPLRQFIFLYWPSEIGARIRESPSAPSGGFHRFGDIPARANPGWIECGWRPLRPRLDALPL